MAFYPYDLNETVIQPFNVSIVMNLNKWNKVPLSPTSVFCCTRIPFRHAEQIWLLIILEFTFSSKETNNFLKSFVLVSFENGRTN